MNSKNRRKIIDSNEVSKIQKVNLNGYEQTICIESKRKTNPIVICLHGGPGSPYPLSVGSRGLFPEFTEHLMMVYWDQYGCGINNHPIDDSFTIDTFVQMTIDLIRYLKLEYPNNALYLFGVSWGSILCVKAAIFVPELIEGVVVYGQVLKQLAFNDETFETLAEANVPSRVSKHLQVLKESNHISKQDLIKMMSYIRKYTNGYLNKNEHGLSMGKIAFDLLSSPDYKFKDVLAQVKNGYEKNNSLLSELLNTDLECDLEKMRVPYYILQGSLDIVTSTKSIQMFVNQSKNQNITLSVIENTGHIPTQTTITRINQLLQVITKQDTHEKPTYR